MTEIYKTKLSKRRNFAQNDTNCSLTTSTRICVYLSCSFNVGFTHYTTVYQSCSNQFKIKGMKDTIKPQICYTLAVNLKRWWHPGIVMNFLPAEHLRKNNKAFCSEAVPLRVYSWASWSSTAAIISADLHADSSHKCRNRGGQHPVDLHARESGATGVYLYHIMCACVWESSIYLCKKKPSGYIYVDYRANLPHTHTHNHTHPILAEVKDLAVSVLL